MASHWNYFFLYQSLTVQPKWWNNLINSLFGLKPLFHIANIRFQSPCSRGEAYRPQDDINTGFGIANFQDSLGSQRINPLLQNWHISKLIVVFLFDVEDIEFLHQFVPLILSVDIFSLGLVPEVLTKLDGFRIFKIAFVSSYKEKRKFCWIHIGVPVVEIGSHLIGLFLVASASTFQPHPHNEFVDLSASAKSRDLQRGVISVHVPNCTETDFGVWQVVMSPNLAIEHGELVVNDLS